ncbi:MAG: hypothetical protein WCJ74_02790, partial [bacterium]
MTSNLFLCHTKVHIDDTEKLGKKGNGRNKTVNGRFWQVNGFGGLDLCVFYHKLYKAHMTSRPPVRDRHGTGRVRAGKSTKNINTQITDVTQKRKKPYFSTFNLSRNDRHHDPNLITL